MMILKVLEHSESNLVRSHLKRLCRPPQAPHLHSECVRASHYSCLQDSSTKYVVHHAVDHLSEFQLCGSDVFRTLMLLFNSQ